MPCTASSFTHCRCRDIFWSVIAHYATIMHYLKIQRSFKQKKKQQPWLLKSTGERLLDSKWTWQSAEDSHRAGSTSLHLAAKNPAPQKSLLWTPHPALLFCANHCYTAAPSEKQQLLPWQVGGSSGRGKEPQRAAHPLVLYISEQRCQSMEQQRGHHGCLVEGPLLPGTSLLKRGREVGIQAVISGLKIKVLKAHSCFHLWNAGRYGLLFFF